MDLSALKRTLAWIDSGMGTRALPLTRETTRRLAWNLTIRQATLMMLSAWRETGPGLRGTDPAPRVCGRETTSLMTRAESTTSNRLLTGGEAIQAAAVGLPAWCESGRV